MAYHSLYGYCPFPPTLLFPPQATQSAPQAQIFTRSAPTLLSFTPFPASTSTAQVENIKGTKSGGIKGTRGGRGGSGNTRGSSSEATILAAAPTAGITAGPAVNLAVGPAAFPAAGLAATPTAGFTFAPASGPATAPANGPAAAPVTPPAAIPAVGLSAAPVTVRVELVEQVAELVLAIKEDKNVIITINLYIFDS